jgi:hypothetical protein
MQAGTEEGVRFYPNGNKSSNNFYNARAAGIVGKIFDKKV